MYVYISMPTCRHVENLHVELENLKSSYNLQFLIYIENSIVSLLKSWEPGV